MLDLFSGSGSASRAAAVRGWDVLRIDNGEGTAHDIRADLSTWMPQALPSIDLVWASPPCTLAPLEPRAGVDLAPAGGAPPIAEIAPKNKLNGTRPCATCADARAFHLRGEACVREGCACVAFIAPARAPQ